MVAINIKGYSINLLRRQTVKKCKVRKCRLIFLLSESKVLPFMYCLFYLSFKGQLTTNSQQRTHPTLVWVLPYFAGTHVTYPHRDGRLSQPLAGIEPRISHMKVHCSTNWPIPAYNWCFYREETSVGVALGLCVHSWLDGPMYITSLWILWWCKGVCESTVHLWARFI